MFSRNSLPFRRSPPTASRRDLLLSKSGTSGRKKERGKSSIMLRASFALLHFDARICSYTGVYLHLARRRSEIPPDLPMTKIMGRGEKTCRPMNTHSLGSEAPTATPAITGVLQRTGTRGRLPDLSL